MLPVLAVASNFPTIIPLSFRVIVELFPYNLIASFPTSFFIVPLLVTEELAPTLMVALLLSEFVIIPLELFVTVAVAVDPDAKIAEPSVVASIVPELVIVMPVVLLLALLLILIVFLVEEI